MKIKINLRHFQKIKSFKANIKIIKMYLNNIQIKKLVLMYQKLSALKIKITIKFIIIKFLIKKLIYQNQIFKMIM